MTDAESIEATILRLCAERGAGKSICPSEVARAIAGPDETVWRLLMRPVREAAFRLAREGRLQVLRKGRPIAPEQARGVIRLTLGSTS
ncbi:DUF3253 domain-containing protein [Elioraea tepidiphila]|jgi:hypothetical protein|uniref:DUF3253 domain-containing protein n=1 Tax=Elioraea tepidiphila TaxID=457934 RepID=UPI00036E591C|nr:DUF3253 domain-containing protein [Elioraea tepidiphila]